MKKGCIYSLYLVISCSTYQCPNVQNHVQKEVAFPVWGGHNLTDLNLTQVLKDELEYQR